MKPQCIFLLMCAAAFLMNVFPSPQDTFKIDMTGPDFTVVNVRTNETRQVAAVRETTGQYYLPIMSRMPEFYHKLLTGYFDYDSVSMTGWDSVFVTVAIVGDVTSLNRGQEGNKAVIVTEKRSRKCAFQHNLRGCRIERQAGVMITKGSERIQKSIGIFY